MDGQDNGAPVAVSGDESLESAEDALEDLHSETQIPGPRPQRARRHPSGAGLPDVSSVQAQIYALTGAQQVMFERVDQAAKLLDQQYSQCQALMTQMNETLKLWQQSFQALDALGDKLARIAAATVKMYQLQIEQDNQGLFS